MRLPPPWLGRRASPSSSFARWFLAVTAGVLALVLALPEPAAKSGLGTPRCKPQKALAFLKRENFVKKGKLDGSGNAKALRYRVEHYGRVEGIPYAELNPESAHSQATSVHFFGLPISVHRAIEPALRCVEKRIRATCQRGADHYTPRAIGGFRDRNTYRGGEVSNHMFGIAIDIDPERNPCCGCVEPWPQHPACQTHGANAVESAALPKCWIEGFERYGFYWLGRDPQLRDTMHFEFLGNPERVVAR